MKHTPGQEDTLVHARNKSTSPRKKRSSSNSHPANTYSREKSKKKSKGTVPINLHKSPQTRIESQKNLNPKTKGPGRRDAWLNRRLVYKVLNLEGPEGTPLYLPLALYPN